MIKRITSKKQRKTIVKVSASLLLILYFTGSCQFEFLHSIVHKHQVAKTHIFGQKLDSCDQPDSYNDIEGGFHYKTHLQASDKCHMCDLVYHGDQTIIENIQFTSGRISADQFDLYKLSLDSCWAVLSSSRAPPVLC